MGRLAFQIDQKKIPESHDWYWDEQSEFIQVFELPEKTSGAFCFSGGNVIPFLQVDWFNSAWGDDMVAFIKQKQYAKKATLLVIGQNGKALIIRP